MHHLQVRNLHKSFSHKVILDGIDFSILKGQKVALVAQNGSGKTTLLKILMGEIEASDGEVVFHKELRMGYLQQEHSFDPEKTVLDTLFDYSHPLGKLIKAYEILLLDPQHNPAEMQKVLTHIEENNARDYVVKLKTIISKLQLSSLLQQSMGSVSGGEGKRILLAKVLLDEPDFLILDEPTNHLDLEMIERLEKYLKDSQLTLLMVTHDRYFLERVCSRIIELKRGKIFAYKTARYRDFLMHKADREEQDTKQLHQLKQLHKKELARMKKDPRARATKSRKRQESFYDIQADFSDKKKNQQLTMQTLELSVVQRRLGNKMLKITNLCKSFGEKCIIDNFSHDFKKGERIGIVGSNGVGKSTFVRILMGDEAYDSGSMKEGETILMGHYQQEHVAIDSDKRVIDILKDVAEYVQIGGGLKLSASQLLERFLFPVKQQHMKAEKLSGGEKRRLHLLKVLIQNPNFLILDEPTNDFDLVTLAILEDFLLHYQGCLLIITHDRFFMDSLVDHLFIFEGDGIISDFRGNYSEWKGQTKVEKVSDDKQGDGISQPEKKVSSSKKLSNKERFELRELERDIEALEMRKEAINLEFQSGGLEHERIKVLGKELSQLAPLLEMKEMRWLELAEKG